ncbi:MAG: neutral zinc metallopeptidase, partial [Pseudomonadota bacterium]
MKTSGRRRSSNIEDLRGRSFGGAGLAGGGLVGLLLFAAVAFLSGADPMQILGAILQQSVAPNEQSSEPYEPTREEQARAEFVAVVLADTEDAWNAEFEKRGGVYDEPALVFFTGAVQSACGFASAAVGPFYCPGDRKVYIDLSFFTELERRFGAPGDFAQAYVVAHEVGHHVQTLLGVSQEVQEAKQTMPPAQSNQMSVRLELQADCYAGFWAHYADNVIGVLEDGDIEEALGAAKAVGDDMLQRQSQGQVRPESFTHGTSEQRKRWFKRGYLAGDP